MGDGPSSPFASSAHLLERLSDLSGRIKNLIAERSGSDRNAQQLGKFMPFFDLLVEELKDVEPGASIFTLHCTLPEHGTTPDRLLEPT